MPLLRFPFLTQAQLAGPAGRTAWSWRTYAFCILGGIVLYSGATALLALRYVPTGMDPRRWALLAAIAAPVWAVAGLAVALAVDAVSRFLFKRDAIGIGLGFVFVGTLLLNVGGGLIGRLTGLALGAVFALALIACVVLLPIAFIQRRIEQRRKKGENT